MTKAAQEGVEQVVASFNKVMIVSIEELRVHKFRHKSCDLMKGH